MENSIRTYADLVTHRDSLKARIAGTKNNMRQNVANLKESLKPARIGYNIVARFFSRNYSSPSLILITQLLTAFILNKVLKISLRGFKRKALTIFIANFISNSIRPAVMTLNNFMLNKFRPGQKRADPI
jgi:hypothetical protein